MKRQSTFHTPRMTLEPGAEYRVLSLHPEWAWAVFHAGKDVENRSWATSYRGPLLIHASSHRSGADENARRRQFIAATGGLSLDRVPDTFVRSAILGVVDILDCVENARSPWASEGSLHWLFHNPCLLAEPVHGIDGKMKLWRWHAPREHDKRSLEPAGTAEETDRTPELERLDEERVLAAFRTIGTQSPENDVDLFRAVSKKLGFSRMGARVEAALRAHARRAVRRGILIREGKRLRAAG